jgi:hypothetical protein
MEDNALAPGAYQTAHHFGSSIFSHLPVLCLESLAVAKSLRSLVCMTTLTRHVFEFEPSLAA